MNQVFEESRTRLSLYSNCFILVWLRTRRSALVLAPFGGQNTGLLLAFGEQNPTSCKRLNKPKVCSGRAQLPRYANKTFGFVRPGPLLSEAEQGAWSRRRITKSASAHFVTLIDRNIYKPKVCSRRLQTVGLYRPLLLLASLTKATLLFVPPTRPGRTKPKVFLRNIYWSHFRVAKVRMAERSSVCPLRGLDPKVLLPERGRPEVGLPLTGARSVAEQSVALKGGLRSAGCLGCLNNPMRGFVQAKLPVSAHQERVALAHSAIDRRPTVGRWVILAERSSWLFASACSRLILGSEHRPPSRSRPRACRAQTLLRKVAKFQSKKTRMAERSRAVYKPGCTTRGVVNSLTNRSQNKPKVCLAVYNPTGCTARFVQASICSGRSATNRRFVGPVRARPRCSLREQHFGCSAKLSNPRYSNRVGFRIILENTGVKWDHRVLGPFWPPFSPRKRQPEPSSGQFCFAKVQATETWFRSTAVGAISLRENAVNRQQTEGLFVPRRLQIVGLNRPVPANFATQSREPAGSRLGWSEGPATQLRPFLSDNSNLIATACSKPLLTLAPYGGKPIGRRRGSGRPYEGNRNSVPVNFARQKCGQTLRSEKASLSTGLAFIRASAPEQTSGLLSPTIKTKSGVNKTRLNRGFKQPLTVWGFIMDTNYCRTEVLGCRKPSGALVDPKRVQLISPLLAPPLGGNRNLVPVNGRRRDFATRKCRQPATNRRFVRTTPFTNRRFVQAGSSLLLQTPCSASLSRGPGRTKPKVLLAERGRPEVGLPPTGARSEAEHALTKPLVLFGLCNFVTKTRYKTIRPLLNLSRENLTTLCKDLGLPVYPDKSNKAVQYSRNRLREQILPAVKLFLNPKIDDALFKLAELLTQDFSVVCHLVNTSSALLQPKVEHSRRRLK